MSYDLAGKKWYSTSDQIFIGNKRISEIWVGHKKIYPDTYPINFAMYCRFDHYVISKYSDIPVNEYGCRLYIDEEHSDYRYTDVVKVAFVWNLRTDVSEPYWSRHIYVRFKDDVVLTSQNPYILYDPYVADYGNIIEDGLSHPLINAYKLYIGTSEGIDYLHEGPVRADLEDKDGNLLTNFTTEISTDNTRLFDNTDDARAYIIS
jgi:hypothetical protein